MWLSDTSFEYLALLDSNGGHPSFPGPFFWHFKKDECTYRRFATELINSKPSLLGIQLIGHDLDNAIGNGIGSVLRNAERLFCTQHLQSRDVVKLKDLGANANTQNRIMADIYGTQKGIIAENGLADSADRDDFNAKLISLEAGWEDLIPGFFRWFKLRRTIVFTKNLVKSARSHLNIKGRFYSNNVESEHRLQKKFLAEEADGLRDIVHVNRTLIEWIDEFYIEMVRRLRGVGKYRLAPVYDQFFVEPAKWNRWSPDRRQQHVDSFLAFKPKPSECYQKPKAAGFKKAPRKKRRNEEGEAEIFVDRIQSTSQAAATAEATTLQPIKISRNPNPSSSNDSWEIVESASSQPDPLDPDRPVRNQFYLVHRSDPKNCPPKVKRCEVCKRNFSVGDWTVVKTEGYRNYTDKKGKENTAFGNVYIHFLTGCLNDHQQNFDFGQIVVLKETLKRLPANSAQKLKDRGCSFE
ncbi:uncharacterized protein [Clytia hemisphaerica]|uniref:uncharacterized protein n=1 Tax=Clytia hemisphaerica TaxID=252671 RepID=UPI0034D60014